MKAYRRTAAQLPVEGKHTAAEQHAYAVYKARYSGSPDIRSMLHSTPVTSTTNTVSDGTRHQVRKEAHVTAYVCT